MMPVLRIQTFQVDQVDDNDLDDGSHEDSNLCEGDHDDQVDDNDDNDDYIEEVWRLSIQSRPRST